MIHGSSRLPCAPTPCPHPPRRRHHSHTLCHPSPAIGSSCAALEAAPIHRNVPISAHAPRAASARWRSEVGASSAPTLNFNHHQNSQPGRIHPARAECGRPLKPGSLGRCLNGPRPVLSARPVRLAGGDTDEHSEPLRHPREPFPVSNHLRSLEKALPDVE